jgi:unsaturated pyranuronate lyase
MVVKSHQVKHRIFNGVEFEVLAVGEKSMITKMKYKLNDEVPLHAHPNEQSGYVISGKYVININGEENIIEKGDSYSIPKNIEHSLKVIIAGEVIDTFSPPRMDYL